MLQSLSAGVTGTVTQLSRTLKPTLAVSGGPAAYGTATLQAAVILLLGFGAVRLLRFITGRMARAAGRGDINNRRLREQRAQTVASLVRSVGTVVIFGVTFLLALDRFIDTGPVLAMAGVAGLAISFGAQSLIRDILNGSFILLEDQYGIGDVIETAGVSGMVEEITLRATTLRDIHGIVHTIPNGEIKVVSNRTKTWSRAVLDVGIAYGEDIDRAARILLEEGLALRTDEEWSPLFIEDPSVLGVNSFQESGMVIRMICKTVPLQQWTIERELRKRIRKRFDREGIRAPYPQRTIHMSGAPAPTLP